MILCDPTAYTVGGILQARTLECVAFPFVRGSSQPRSPPLQADSLPSEPPGKPKNTGLGSLSLLQGIFLIQQLNRDLLHCREILYQLRYQVRPISLVLIYNWKFLPFGHFQAIPCPPTSYPMLLVATNLISFPVNFCVSF